MKQNPTISFCIATYKRPEVLTTTIEKILMQTYKNYEIIVSDNDSSLSAKPIVSKFKRKNIFYYHNNSGPGMVNNFNNAFKKSTGEFIVFMSDDDPPTKDMLDTLIDLYLKYPNCGSYFGASYLYSDNSSVSSTYKITLGKTSMRNKTKRTGAVNIYSTNNFIKEFLSYQIFPYFLWSTGIVKREIVQLINGMPSYDSPYLTDYAYIGLVGSIAPMLVVNKELGMQSIHMNNFGRSKKDLDSLIKAVEGFNRLIKPLAYNSNCEKEYNYFLSHWIIDHLISVSQFNKNNKILFHKETYLKIFNKASKEIPSISKWRLEFIIRLYSPNFIANIFNYRYIFSPRIFLKTTKFFWILLTQ